MREAMLKVQSVKPVQWQPGKLRVYHQRSGTQVFYTEEPAYTYSTGTHLCSLASSGQGASYLFSCYFRLQVFHEGKETEGFSGQLPYRLKLPFHDVPAELLDLLQYRSHILFSEKIVQLLRKLSMPFFEMPEYDKREWKNNLL